MGSLPVSSPSTLRTCRKCGSEKPLAQFRERSDRPGQFKYECLECERTRMAKYRAAHPVEKHPRPLKACIHCGAERGSVEWNLVERHNICLACFRARGNRNGRAWNARHAVRHPCVRCGVVDVTHKYCKECRAAVNRERSNNRKRQEYVHKGPFAGWTEALCRRCGEVKPREEFGSGWGKAENTWCAACARSTWFARLRPTPEERRARKREQRRQWRERNRETWLAQPSRWRRRTREERGSFTGKEWIELCKRYGWKCLRCGVYGGKRGELRLTVDHVVPLALGGMNTIENIQPLCGDCNRLKGATEHDYRVLEQGILFA